MRNMKNKKLIFIAAASVGLTIFTGGSLAKAFSDQNSRIEDLNKKLTSCEQDLVNSRNEIREYKHQIKAYEEKVSIYNEYFTQSICEKIDEIAPAYGIPSDFAKALISLESNFDPTVQTDMQAGVALLTKPFAEANDILVDDVVDERITDAEKCLHAVFRNINSNRNFVKRMTGKDDLRVAYSLHCLGKGRYMESLLRGKIPNILTDNAFLQNVDKRVKYFQ